MSFKHTVPPVVVCPPPLTTSSQGTHSHLSTQHYRLLKHCNRTTTLRTGERDKPTQHSSSASDTSITHRVQHSVNHPQQSHPTCVCVCPYHSCVEEHVQQAISLSHPLCPSCAGAREFQQQYPHTPNNHSFSQTTKKDLAKPAGEVSVVEPFSSLRVSGCPMTCTSGVGLVSQSGAPVLRSCREEAASTASVNHLDDTTVDDLAGYLDEIMFIPKPMSEMAELMYT